jgi:ubiquinone biosynthesis protein Coq4
MAARLRALEHCPPESLGRAYYDFYQRYGLKFPGEPGGGDVIFVAHDFTHVLAGYEPDGPGELSLQAMRVSATDGDHHFSNFCASLSLHEAGMLDSSIGITPKVGTLARPGAAEELADAIRRGAQCKGDFATTDHLAHVDEPLEDVRRELSIPGRRS